MTGVQSFINQVVGVDIKITAAEAKYLNNRHLSKKEFEAKFYGKDGKKQELHSKEEVDAILANIEKAK